MNQKTVYLLLLYAVGVLLQPGSVAHSADFAPPPVMLANIYRADTRFADYWVSEKLDGVRGYWDGEKLLTRGGERIAAPSWFTAGLPKIPMDGELWVGRGKFEETVSIILQHKADDAAWRKIRFMVFDLPAHPGAFTERNDALKTQLAVVALPWVRQVEQIEVADHLQLRSMLDRVVKNGGEGLMLHRGASLYRAERSDDLLKLKPYQDAEARVIGHLPGKGKNSGRAAISDRNRVLRCGSQKSPSSGKLGDVSLHRPE